MIIRITGHNSVNLKENLDNILNVVSILCFKGYIPIKEDIEEAERTGRYWYQSEENLIDLAPISNNYWAFIKDKGELPHRHFIDIEFGIRYDRDNKKKETLTNLIVAWFDCAELVVKKSEEPEVIEIPKGYAKSINPVLMPDGKYKGMWGGYFVNIPELGIVAEVNEGVRGINCECQVIIQDGWLYAGFLSLNDVK
jgi:hypothetical protein